MFTCYPFMIANKFEGDDEWDTFDFETGIAQNVNFKINGSRTINLINDSVIPVTPEITTDAPLTIQTGGNLYQVSAGVSKEIPLQTGTNRIDVTGQGNISFAWRREVI